jgi:cation:H+ antiporter
MMTLSGLPLWAELLSFGAAAILIWFAGSRLARYVDILTEKITIGRAFAGMLMLGSITSLPEMSAVSTAAAFGNASLAINTLLGSLALNVAMIAVADINVRGAALSSRVAEPGALYQAALCMIALSLTIAAIVTGDRLIIGTGSWTMVICAFVLVSFWLASGFAYRSPWRVRRPVQDQVGAGGGREVRGDHTRREIEWKVTKGLAFKIGFAALAILVSGYVLSRSSEAIAQQIGLRTSMAGFVLLGTVTSLPELATILAAARLGRFDMAVADSFGTNLVNLGLLVVADAFYPGGPILNQAGRFEIAACLLCLVLTAIYVLGLLEHHKRTIFGMGYDSLAVVCSYIFGIALLSWIK